MTVVLVCGSREWTDPVPIRDQISKLCLGDVVIHGDQRGADLIADNEARKLGLQVISSPADWDAGPSAGPDRNSKMLRMLSRASKVFGQKVNILAFHHDSLLGRGTRDMVRKSIWGGFRVKIFLSSSFPVIRAGTHVKCSECGLSYLKHPEIISELDQDGYPFLNLSCHGEFLKL
jgi:hypothetical protein